MSLNTVFLFLCSNISHGVQAQGRNQWGGWGMGRGQAAPDTQKWEGRKAQKWEGRHNKWEGEKGWKNGKKGKGTGEEKKKGEGRWKLNRKRKRERGKKGERKEKRRIVWRQGCAVHKMCSWPPPPPETRETRWGLVTPLSRLWYCWWSVPTVAVIHSRSRPSVGVFHMGIFFLHLNLFIEHPSAYRHHLAQKGNKLNGILSCIWVIIFSSIPLCRIWSMLVGGIGLMPFQVSTHII